MKKSIFEMEKTISTIKETITKEQINLLECMCNLSHTTLATGEGVALNIKNNNVKYVAGGYLSHEIFENIQISLSYKIDILTLAYLGAIIHNTNNGATLTPFGSKWNKYNLNEIQSNYTINLKNGLQIIILDSDAKSKKYFNLLKTYKRSIAKLDYFIYTFDRVLTYTQDDLKFYPPYIKKLQSYILGLSYNPDSKNDCIKYW